MTVLNTGKNDSPQRYICCTGPHLNHYTFFLSSSKLQSHWYKCFIETKPVVRKIREYRSWPSDQTPFPSWLRQPQWVRGRLEHTQPSKANPLRAVHSWSLDLMLRFFWISMIKYMSEWSVCASLVIWGLAGAGVGVARAWPLIFARRGTQCWWR